jgi:hypothetical protein
MNGSKVIGVAKTLPTNVGEQGANHTTAQSLATLNRT